MPAILTFNTNRAVDLNGIAVPGALAVFYDSGTSAERMVYSDPDCTLPHPSPLASDGAGVFPAVYVAGTSDIKVDVFRPDGVSLAGYPMDPAGVITTELQGASGVVFNPTEEIPETNVQAAIEAVYAAIVAPLVEFGLGVSGSVGLLSSIDVNGTASGFYRYDGTTEGTFPAGVVKNDGGLVLIFRRTSSSALMLLIPVGADRIYLRRLESSWQAWSYLMRSVDTVANAIWQAGSSTTPVTATPAGVMAGIRSKALGEGQSWQAVTRAVGTTYTNSTGRAIMVIIAVGSAGAGDRVQVSPDGTNWVSLSWFGDRNTSFVVPPGHRYRLTGGSFTFWSELR